MKKKSNTTSKILNGLIVRMRTLFSRKRLTSVLLFVTAMAASFGIFIFITTDTLEASWWDLGWLYRRQIDFGNAGGATNNEVVSFSVDTATLISAGKLQSGCQDIRFTDADNNLLQHRINDNQAGIVYKNSTDYSATGPGTSFNFNHTVTSGTDQVLVLVLQGQHNSGGSGAWNVDTVTYNGDSMTNQLEYDTTTTNRFYATSIWTLVNPDTGTNSVAITTSLDVANVIASAMTFEGVDSSTPVGATATNYNDSASTLSVSNSTTYDRSVIVGGALRRHGNQTLGGSPTSDARNLETPHVLAPGKEIYAERILNNDSDQRFGAAGGFQYAPISGSQTMSYEIERTDNTHWQGAWIELKAEEGATDCNTASTDFEVLFPDIASGSNIAYMYYGNASAPSVESDLADPAKAIALNGSPTEYTSTTSTDSHSFSHSVSSGENQMLVVIASAMGAQTNESYNFVDSITYNSVQLVKTTYAQQYTSNRNVDIEIWTLKDPPTGSNTVALEIDSPGAPADQYNITALTYEYVAQNYNNQGGSNTNTASSSISANVTTTSERNLLVGGAWRRHTSTNDAVSVGSPGTTRYEEGTTDGGDNNMNAGGGESQALTAGSRSISFSAANIGQTWQAVVANLEPESTYDEFSPSTGPTVDNEEEAPGPSGWWKFDEGVDNTCSGGTNDTCDSIEGTNDGAISNGTAWETPDKCVNGNCLFFDGSDDVVTVTNDPMIDFDLGLAGGISASFWIRPITDGENSTGEIFDKGSHMYCRTDNESSGVADLQCSIDLATTDPTVNVSGGLTLGQWHHIVVTYEDDGDDDLLVYINGHLAGSADGDGAPVGSDTSNLLFGGDSSNNYHGFLDDFKIYPYERTESQVLTDYVLGASQSGSAVSLGVEDNRYLSDGLIGYWPMEESSWISDCSTDTVTDESGFGDNADACGDADTTVGKFGNGGTFDGTGDYIDLNNTMTIDKESFAVSLWFNTTASADDKLFSLGGANHPVQTFNGNIRLCFTTCTVGSTTINDGEWHHVVAVGTDQYIRMYLDGVLEFERSPSVGTVSGVPSIAAVGGGTPNLYFTGEIDDVRVYNTSLTGDEVKGLYNWTPGPLGYWPMDENTGTSTTYDRSSNGYNASFNGSMTESDWVPGKIGSGLEFDQSNDYLSASSSINLANRSFSVGGWIKRSDAGDSDYIFTQGTNSNSQGLHLGYDSTNVIRCGFWSDDLDTSDTYTGSEWRHIFCTYDANTNQRKLYVNGVNVAEDTASADFSGTGSFVIGSRQFGAVQYTGGVLDEVKVYDYQRTSAQVVEDMNGGHPVGGSPIGSQIIHYKFDELTGSTINNDVSQHSTLNGTITNAVWQNEDCFADGCLDYDGTGDYVSTSDATALDFTGDFTLSAWVNRESGGAISRSVISKMNVTPNGAFALHVGNLGEIYCHTYNGSSSDTSYTTTGLVTDSTGWTHIAAVRNGSTCRLYVNGQDMTTSFGTHTTMVANNEPLRIGSDPGNAQYWYGDIDEVKVYGAALTQEQLLIDMQANASSNFGTGTNERDVLSDGDYYSDLVGYWPMDENTGTSTTADKSINSNNGTLNSTEESDWIPGIYGSAISLDGSAEYVNMGDQSVHDFGVGEDFSISYWVNTTSTTGGDVVSKSSGAAPHYRTTMGAGGLVATTVNDGSNTASSTATTAVNDGKWHHIAFTYDRDNNIRVYVDGLLEDSDNMSSVGSLANSGNLVIGRFGSSSSQYKQVSVDELKIFSTVLTPAQVAYEYNRGVPVGWWRFDECTGSNAYDASGKGSHGTITEDGSGSNNGGVGTCDSGAGDEMWDNGTTGRFGASLDFDGTDDYVDLEGNPIGDLLDGSEVVSMAAWFRIGSYPAASSYERIIFATNHVTGLGLTMSTYSNAGAIRIGARSVNTDSVQEVESNQTFATGEWIHAVGIIDFPNDMMYLYLNGQLDNTASVTFNNTSYTQGTPSQNDFIGTYNGATQDFDGQIDDVRIYNYGLSGAQVLNIMNHGAVRFE